MTGVEKAKIEFKTKFDTVKTRHGWTNKDLAKILQCSLPTVSRLRNDPFSASGYNLMTIHALYEESNGQ